MGYAKTFIEEFEYYNKKFFSLKEEYTNSKTRISVKCKRCNTTKKYLPKALKSKIFCGKCDTRYYNSSFSEKVNLKTEGKYEVKGEYINNHTSVAILHIECGNTVFIRPNAFLNSGSRCAHCYGGVKKSHRDYLAQLELYDLEILEEYRGNKTPVWHRCRKCGIKEKRTPNTVLGSKGGCSSCNGNKKYDTSSYSQLLKGSTNGEHEALEEYKGMFTPILHKHKCGYSWKISPNNIIHTKNTCPSCNGGIKYTSVEYKKRLQKRSNGTIKLLELYQNAQTPLLHKHTVCGHEWRVRPNSLLRGTGCPICNKDTSKGERAIETWLQKHRLYYTREFREHSCKNIFALPFDFAVFKDAEKSELTTLIEFDGIQHFKPVEFFGGKRGYTKQKKNDYLKNMWTKKNGITLLRIGYRNLDIIEKVLDEELSHIVSAATPSPT